MPGLFFCIEPIEHWIIHLLQSGESALLTQTMLGITFFGNPLFWLLVVSAVYWQGREKEAFYIALLTLLSAAVVGALKLFFARPRPSPEVFKRLATDYYTPFSFPSGHAAIIAAYWGYAAERIKKTQAALLFVAVLLVGLSRIYLGVHFLSDVAAGIIIGILVGKAVALLKNKAKRCHLKPNKLREGLAITAIIGASIAALLLLESIPIAAAFLGFFAGFFICREKNFKSHVLRGKALITKELLGFAVIGLALTVMPPALGEQRSAAFLYYAAIGLWVSCIWPVSHQKLLKKLQAK
jgi:undecaprenyl-diphosphatase